MKKCIVRINLILSPWQKKHSLTIHYCIASSQNMPSLWGDVLKEHNSLPCTAFILASKNITVNKIILQ